MIQLINLLREVSTTLHTDGTNSTWTNRLLIVLVIEPLIAIIP
jgi:hypothetical protein